MSALNPLSRTPSSARSNPIAPPALALGAGLFVLAALFSSCNASDGNQIIWSDNSFASPRIRVDNFHLPDDAVRATVVLQSGGVLRAEKEDGVWKAIP